MRNPTLPKWISNAPHGAIVKLYIQPRASRSEIVGEHGDAESVRLKVRIAAPPVDGEASEELIQFLKRITSIPVSRLHLIRGETTRSKDVLFEGASANMVFEKLVVSIRSK